MYMVMKGLDLKVLVIEFEEDFCGIYYYYFFIFYENNGFCL